MKLGVCVGEPTTREAEFIGSTRVQLGEYVELNYDGKRVLGFIKSLKRVRREISSDFSPQDLEAIIKMSGLEPVFVGKIAILGEIDTGAVPRVPPEPGTPVYLASKETLEKVFGKNKKEGIFIGHLLTRNDVQVYVDVNEVVRRHLAILAITGAGKSNTVSVVIEGILEKGGSILVFDMHGEYVDFSYEVNGKKCVKKLKLTLNPTKLSYAEFRQFLNVDDSAFVQDRYLREAFKEALEAINKGEESIENFWGFLSGYLEQAEKDNNIDRRSIVAVRNKLEDAQENYNQLFSFYDPPILEQIELEKLNVIDLSQVDERTADIIVSHVLRNLLEARKAAVRESSSGFVLDFPVLTVIEEAHILASASVPTRSKYWISRVAREGRKFGLGLCLVSQRPKALDPNTLSQANNMIILKLIEPNDQRHVQQASEALSSELIEQLPSLNVGEALVMGAMISVPALVKIRRAESKRSGTDINILEQWKESRKKRKFADESLDNFFNL